MKRHFLNSLALYVTTLSSQAFLTSVNTTGFVLFMNILKVHGAMSQVVFPSDVGDLFGLHGLQLGAVCDTMAETSAERAAPLSWESVRQVSKSLQTAHRHRSRERKRIVLRTSRSPPMSSMVSSPVCSTWRTGGTFCLASTSRAFRSIRTDSSIRRHKHALPESCLWQYSTRQLKSFQIKKNPSSFLEMTTSKTIHLLCLRTFCIICGLNISAIYPSYAELLQRSLTSLYCTCLGCQHILNVGVSSQRCSTW